MRVSASSASRGAVSVRPTTSANVFVPAQGLFGRRNLGLRLSRPRLRVLADTVDLHDKDNNTRDDDAHDKLVVLRMGSSPSTRQASGRVDMPGIVVQGGPGIHVQGYSMPESSSSSTRMDQYIMQDSASGQPPPPTYDWDRAAASLSAASAASSSSSSSPSSSSLISEPAHHDAPIAVHDDAHAAAANGSSPHHHGAPPSSTSSLPTAVSDGPNEKPAPEAAPEPKAEQQHVPGIPQPILIISLISATLTMTSCVFQTLLPIYMVTELKMTMRSMGMFEGLLEAFSYIVRMFSGVISDMMTSRKSAITLGFAMGAMAKFGMSGATEVGSLFASKAVDRLANGVQAAPRDALISDLAPSVSRGSCFGFAQSMRKWGSMCGATMVYFLMKASGNNYQLIFTMAATVSLASCAAFVFFVPSHVRPKSAEEQAGSGKAKGFQLGQFFKDVVSMGPDFYRMLLIVSLYGMGHINESLLEARAMEVGFGKAESTLVVAALAFVIFCVAYPLGRLDDKYGPRVTFAVGMAALLLGDLVLLVSGTQPWAVFVSLLFMGIHMGVIQGPLLSIVVGLAPGNLRGTAFGIFYTVMAITAMGANSLFGTLWHSFGATSAFGISAAMTAVTLLALPWLLPDSAKSPKQQLAAAPA